MRNTFDILKLARETSKNQTLSTETKDKALLFMADSLIESTDDILKGFKPDLVIVKNKKDNKILKDVIIAVTHKKLFKDCECSAILNPQM